MNAGQAGQAAAGAAIAAFAAWGVAQVISAYRELQFLRENYEDVERELEKQNGIGDTD